MVVSLILWGSHDPIFVSFKKFYLMSKQACEAVVAQSSSYYNSNKAKYPLKFIKIKIKVKLQP